MALDPILKRLISQAYAQGFGEIHLLSSEQMRNFLKHPKMNIEQASYQDFKAVHDLILRCYTPVGISEDTPLPVILYISASAFVLDRLDVSNDYCSLLANTTGMKVINIAHRLAPEHKFPIFLYDCLECIHWIYENHQQVKILPDKIALWGESSGASIAATCTHILRDNQTPLIQHQTLIYPMVDLVSPFPSKEAYGYGYMLDKPFIQWLDDRGFEPSQDRASPLASPLLSTHFSQLPPATIITAEYDPLRDEGEAYMRKCINAGVAVKYKQFDGMIHGFMRFYNKVKAANEALDFACNALKNHFSYSHSSEDVQ